jgi:hypothetical protein
MPDSLYRQEGPELGFRFSSLHLAKTRHTQHRRLGVRRYMPTGKSSLNLGIPPGALVLCFLA